LGRRAARLGAVMAPLLLPLLLLGCLLVLASAALMARTEATVPRMLCFAAGTFLALFGAAHLVAYWHMGLI
jgi:hypothetical protein